MLAALTAVADSGSNPSLLIVNPRGVPIQMTLVIELLIPVLGRVYMSLLVSVLEPTMFEGKSLVGSLALLKTNAVFVALGLFFGPMSAVSEIAGAAVCVCLALTCCGQCKGQGALLSVVLINFVGMDEGVNASGEALA